MPYHALEVLLTRPLVPAELRDAAHVLPLATNHDTTRLMTLVRAKTPGRAAHRPRRTPAAPHTGCADTSPLGSPWT
jgi:hypothetical protein